jgi:ribosomal-protein-alanine N-acetyltransferase
VRRPDHRRRVALFAPLETERLLLEPIRADHADGMFEGLRDPSLYAYQTDEPPSDLASLRERYERLASARSPDGRFHWLNWIVVRRDGGGTAGYVQATVREDRSSAEIGYLILVAHQRRDFASESVAAVVRHLFRAGVDEVHAVVDVRNRASIALIERLGFTRTKTRESDDVIDGVRWFDHEYVRRRPGVRGFPALETPRMRLEPIRAGHADALIAGLRDPSLYTYLADETPPKTRAELRERFARSARKDAWVWALVMRDGAGAAGIVEASSRYGEGTGVLHYVVAHRFQRRGLAREAVAAVLEFLLRRGLHHVWAPIDPRNRPGAAVLEALGFECNEPVVGMPESVDADGTDGGADDEEARPDDAMYMLDLPVSRAAETPAPNPGA